MSIAYLAPVQVDPGLPTIIRDELLVSDEYEILSGSANTISLRRRAQPLRENWPEDVEIRFNNGILVTFHSADRVSRRRLLERIQSVLTRLGHSATFTEE